MRSIVDPRLLKQLYQEKRNLMSFMRTKEGGNDESAILAAYDMQSGSYSAAMENPELLERNLANTCKFARLFDQLGCSSLLHGGTGEAKTVSHIVDQMQLKPENVYGFDLSLSRLFYGRNYASRVGLNNIHFFLGSLMSIPIQDDAFDIVFTSHSMEPNGGCEREILQELYRVSRRYVVLREPSYELGNALTRAHIAKHGYVRDIPSIICELGYKVVEYALFGDDENPNNQSALTVIVKNAKVHDNASPWQLTPGHPYATPVSRAKLQYTAEAYYSEQDGLIFPILSGIPCLVADCGVYSSKYLQFAPTANAGAV